MDSPLVINERRDAVAIIRLNRPEKLNALTREMILALSDTFKKIDLQPNLRAIILTGAGDKAFCAGTDISELAEAAGLDDDHAGDRARELAERGQALCNQIENCRVPVIAAINGIAAGGGCELALACHLRVASGNAQFSLPETKLSLIPAYGGTQRLAREIGNGRALEMMLTGKTIGAEEALQFGLVIASLRPASHSRKLKSWRPRSHSSLPSPFAPASKLLSKALNCRSPKDSPWRRNSSPGCFLRRTCAKARALFWKSESPSSRATSGLEYKL